MYIPEEMKVNKFVAVKLPDNATYFARYGSQNVNLPYTGDEVATLSQNKVDSIADYMEYCRYMAEHSKDESNE